MLLQAQSDAHLDFNIALQEEVQDGKLLSSDLHEYLLGSSHTSSISGVTYYYLQQQYRGIDIDGAIATFSKSEKGNLTLLNSRWERDIVSRASSLAYTHQVSNVTTRVLTREGISQKSRSSSRVKSRPLWIGQEQQLKFAVEIYFQKEKKHWRVFSDLSGNIISRRNLVLRCNHDHLHGYTNECAGINPNRTQSSKPQEMDLADTYLVYPLGTASPNHGSQFVISDPADGEASPFGWHDTDGTEGPEHFDTRGNNVQVQEDTLANDFGGFRPSGGSDLAFLFPHDPNIGDESQVSAALTNLFYWININHDILYHHGFDPPAGNFQINNYGNPGLDGDPIVADALDGAGTNNAIFFPAPDGEANRLETFLWTGSIFDTELVVGDPANPLTRISAVENQFSQANQLIRVGSVSGLATQVVDGNGSTLACDPNQIINPSTLNNRLAVVDRGECFFIAKAANVAQHNAAALIVIQNQSASPFPMGGSDATLTIPSVMISKNAGEELRQILNDNPTIPITLQLKPPAISRGASFDNAVITHEYAHGLTSRLTGGKQTITCLLNFEQMSEGWSDYFGLMFTTDWAAAQSADRFGIGSYLVGDAIEGPGIRVFPYTTDFGVNPLTYDDLPDLQIPHGIGELWAAALWDLTWIMIEQDGITTDLYNGIGGNTNAMKLVIEALKIQPCSPGFVDARDALIRAATNLGWEKYHYAIWSAFARRGLGEQADQGRVDSPIDGESSFNIPANFETILETFELIPEQNQIKISWGMLQEYGTAHFELIRSEGEITNQTIERTDASFISSVSQNYHATDQNITPNQWYIYELVLENFDGSRVSLATDSVIIIPTKDIAVFPVPAQDELFVSIGNLQQPVSDLIIYDNRGVMLYRESEELAPFATARIAIDHFPAGMYYLQTHAGAEVFWRKFVVH